MPEIKVERIISCSSEDPDHKSENILSTDASKTWTCKIPREKTERSVFVILQLEKASVISGIDIGNDHSAYVEVLVSRTGMDDEYKSLLVPSALMNPLESRQSQNTKGVRMFTREHFSKPECDEKWDRVKIVCLQLFNQHVPFGLSFVKLHTSNSAVNADNAHNKTVLMRPKSPESYQPGYLFNKRKELDQNEKLSGAAAIRNVMRNSGTLSPVCAPKFKKNEPTPQRKIDMNEFDEDNVNPKAKPRHRDELLYNKDEEQPNEKIDRIIEKMKQETKEKEMEDEKGKKEDAKKKFEKHSTTKKQENSDLGLGKRQNSETGSPSTSKNSSDREKNEGKNRHSLENKRKHHDSNQNKKPKKAKIEKTRKPFDKLLEGIKLVISGIPNPDRSEIRSKALEMGAKYKGDWDDSCTHLVCAFVNTPKFNQVKGRGKIVKRDWIEECYSQRKRLPWRRYALDRNDKGDESEEEVWEETDSLCNDSFDEHAVIDDYNNSKGKIEMGVYDADTDEEDLSRNI